VLPWNPKRTGVIWLLNRGGLRSTSKQRRGWPRINWRCDSIWSTSWSIYFPSSSTRAQNRRQWCRPLGLLNRRKRFVVLGWGISRGMGSPRRQPSVSTRGTTGFLQMLQPLLWRELRRPPFQLWRPRCKERHLQVDFPLVRSRDIVNRHPIFPIKVSVS